MDSNNRRIMLYSHDTQGLGHLRRNLSIATALRKAEPTSSILLVTGTGQGQCLPHSLRRGLPDPAGAGQR